MLLRKAVVISLALSGCAHAQALVEASLSNVQPIVSRDAEGFSICGIRTTVLVERASQKAEVYDFSLQYSVGAVAGMMKIGKNTADLSKPNVAPKPVVPAPRSAWGAREMDGAPLALQILFESPDSPGYVMANVEAAKGFEIMLAMAAGERMHLVARYKSEPYDSIISYQVGLEKRELALLQACTNQLIERWEKSFGSSAER